MIKSVTKVRVLYAHTDIMGIANNTRYLEYFEAGRNELLRSMGYPYTELESKGVMLPLIEAHLKFITGAKYDDEVDVYAILKEVPRARIKIFYEVKRGDELLAEGYTVHAFVSPHKFKAQRPPADLIDLIKSKM